jgi:hypothetical protein
MSIIYLDQWVYVTFLRTYKGLPPDYPKYAEICKGIIESSQNGINKFPFSFAHLEETLKRDKLSSRKELFKFIFDLSRFYTIRTLASVIIELEVNNAIRKSLGGKPIDLSDRVFGNELCHCFGSKVEIKSVEPNKEIPEELKDKLYSACKDPELMADALCTYQMIDVKQSFQRNNDLADKLEELRKKEYSHPDKNMRKNISDARFLIDFIRDEFIKAVLEYKLDFKKYTQHIFSSKESTIAFLRSIPTAYTFHVLNDARNLNTSRPIEPNDFWDLCTLATAVPYCDVVVTEREWSNILNQKRIGELYNTKIIHRIEDLSEFI